MSPPNRDLTTRGYDRIITLLVALVIVPTAFMTAAGVLMLVRQEATFTLTLGVLVLSLSGLLITGVVLVWVFLARARSLSQLQSDFVSKVSHELRTPLASILMFSETLRLRRGDVAMEDKCIDALEREGARLRGLIDRLLDWSRMESGHRTYARMPHDARDIVQAAINAFEPARERRDVELSVKLPEAPVTISCDEPALVDAVVNLLSNAYKYGGTPRFIEVSLEPSAARTSVQIRVRDNGPGVPHSEHKKIFEKFYRLGDLLAREQQGTGLGLAIVQHIVRGHGGRVEVESEPGQGSTFTITIPASS